MIFFATLAQSKLSGRLNLNFFEPVSTSESDNDRFPFFTISSKLANGPEKNKRLGYELSQHKNLM